MFIKFTICSEIVLPAEEYTANSGKSIRNHVFKQYLFKIVNFGSQANGICVRIESIQVLGNVIIRKTADLKVKIKVSMIILRLVPNQFYEGLVKSCDEEGIDVSFVGGLLIGHIPLQNLHSDTIFHGQKNQWILTANGNKGYEWKIGGKVRFKIEESYFSIQRQQNQLQSGTISMKDLIRLRANEGGLGPVQWWE